MSLDRTLASTHLFVVKYLAWFGEWTFVLLYQFGTVLVGIVRSKYVVLFLDIVSDYNVTSKFVGVLIA